MQRIIKELKSLMDSELYYSSLFLALSLIDICAKIENFNIKFPKGYNSYMKWVDTFYCPLFEKNLSVPLISSKDIYTMRCKILHEGTIFLSNDDCTRIILTIGGKSHRNIARVSDGKITIIEKQLNVKLFINEILDSINKWAINKHQNELTLDFNIIDGNFSSTPLNGMQAFHNCK